MWGETVLHISWTVEKYFNICPWHSSRWPQSSKVTNWEAGQAEYTLSNLDSTNPRQALSLPQGDVEISPRVSNSRQLSAKMEPRDCHRLSTGHFCCARPGYNYCQPDGLWYNDCIPTQCWHTIINRVTLSQRPCRQYKLSNQWQTKDLVSAIGLFLGKIKQLFSQVIHICCEF